MKKHFALIVFLVFVNISFAQSGNVLVYNGSSTFVTIPSGYSLLANKNLLTIEVWLKTNTYNEGRILSSNGLTFYLRVNSDNSIAFRMGGVSNEIKTNANVYPTDGSWHHIAVVINSGSSDDQIYLDGNLAAMSTNNFGASYNGVLDLWFGAYPNYGYNFNGAIDEVRIWNIARSQTEIKSSMDTTLTGNESGLIGYWKFDESTLSDQNVYDSQTNSTVHSGFLGSSSAIESSDPTRTGLPLITAVEDNNSGIPQKYLLDQNYPNPFNPSTIIRYAIPKESNVKIIVYNILGEAVQNLIEGEKAPGNYEVNFDASKLSSGVYFYRIEAGSFNETKKMLLLK